MFQTEPNDKLRADHSCPIGLTVKQSKIPNGGYGVWAIKGFPKGVRFGPYAGKINHDAEDVHASGYSWQVSQIKIFIVPQARVAVGCTCF